MCIGDVSIDTVASYVTEIRNPKSACAVSLVSCVLCASSACRLCACETSKSVIIVRFGRYNTLCSSTVFMGGRIGVYQKVLVDVLLSSRDTLRYVCDTT